MIAALLFALFGDGFEGNHQRVEGPPQPLYCYYQTGWPGNAISDAPGNCVDIYQPTLHGLSQAISLAQRKGFRIILDSRSANWWRVADNPAVVAINAMDEPDLLGFDHRHRWDTFVTGLLAIKARTDKPVFCNFAALSTNALAGKARHLPNHPDYNKAGGQWAIRRPIPSECDWLGFTPAYGTLNLGPVNELLALGKPVLLVADAYDGWDRTCGSPLNCQGWRLNKIRQQIKIMQDNPQVRGIYFFLKGRPVGDTGCGTDCQPWLRGKLSEMGIY